MLRTPCLFGFPFALLFLIVTTPLHAQYHEPDNGKEELPKVKIRLGIPIPMRDKVKLSATVYEAVDRKEPQPAIVVLTPYERDNFHKRGMYFAGKGFVFVMADTRGRGNSGGKFEPFINEGKDGHDVVEWVAKQKWCNGKVGMYGGSYSGIVQWATLKERPPHLKTIVPVSSPHVGVDFPTIGGIFPAYFLRWLTSVSGNTLNQELFNDNDYWRSRFLEHYQSFKPYRELARTVGVPNPHFQTWLDHRVVDDYWKSLILTDGDYKKIDVPILTISGQYDVAQAGSMEYFLRHMKHGSDEHKRQHYLILGPWDHAGTRTPKSLLGGVDFGKRSELDMNKLHEDWFNWTLRDGPKPKILVRRIVYYVSGLNRWKDINELKRIPTKMTKLYLHSDGKSGDVFHSGQLSPEVPDTCCKPARYTYNPIDTRPAELEKKSSEEFLTKQGHVINMFGHGLVYHTKPFTEKREIAGKMKFVAWIKLNVPDTDFHVSVFEIQPNGSSVYLAESQLRTRYRTSSVKETLVEPGKILRYEFSGFNFVHRVLQQGSRLRFVFRTPNSIYLEKNFNTGGPVEEQQRKDMRTAEVTLYHDAEHPTHLQIPEGLYPR